MVEDGSNSHDITTFMTFKNHDLKKTSNKYP